jgi:hypothetical protein
MAGPVLHPAVEGLSFLLGTWRGEGRGDYPTIEPFAYREEIELWHVGKPFLAYRQRTVDAGTDQPLHAEMGYWRPGAAATGVELVLAHPSGITEVYIGGVDTEDGTRRISLRTTSVSATPTAKRVDELVRELRVAGDTLTYDVHMAAVGQPLTHHLSATLSRVER